jgi:hypothetical protein
VTADKTCKDCEPGSKRPAPNPGPRCATHWREEKKRRSKAAHEKRVQTTYGLGEGDYDRLYESQGGRCAICPRATGATRRLSVDHDHKNLLVRGLLCRPCNDMLGHARDDPAFFERAKAYLEKPPAQNLGTWYAK